MEVGERKIKGDPLIMMNELDQLVYGGKKVTRADLEASDKDDVDDDESDGDNNMEVNEEDDEEIDSDEYG